MQAIRQPEFPDTALDPISTPADVHCTYAHHLQEHHFPRTALVAAAVA